MYDGKTVAAVIPAYNEEEFIGAVIDTLPPFIDRAYVIDDGSTDNTWDRIQSHAEKRNTGNSPDVVGNGGQVTTVEQNTEVVPVKHESNRGVGAAIKTGYSRAVADRMDITTVIAGDGQTESDIVERIVKPVASGRADYSKGNRMLTREGMPMFRQIGNFMLALLTKIASGYWKVNDPQNGSTAISLAALESIAIDELYNDYGFVNNLLVHLNVHRMRIADVPRRAVYKNEKSHIKYSTFVPKLSWLLLRNFLWRLRVKYLERDFHPLAFLYLFGAVVTGTGFTGIAFGLVGIGTIDGGIGYLGFIIGSLMLILAMIFDHFENESLQIVGHFER